MQSTHLDTLIDLAVEKVGSRSAHPQVFHTPLWDLRLSPQDKKERLRKIIANVGSQINSKI